MITKMTKPIKHCMTKSSFAAGDETSCDSGGRTPTSAPFGDSFFLEVSVSSNARPKFFSVSDSVRILVSVGGMKSSRNVVGISSLFSNLFFKYFSSFPSLLLSFLLSSEITKFFCCIIAESDEEF